MSLTLVKQSNGLYALFNTIDDTFILWDADVQAVTEFIAERAANRERWSAPLDIERGTWKAGSPKESLARFKAVHGAEEANRMRAVLYARKRPPATEPGGFSSRLDIPHRYSPEVVLEMQGERVLTFHGYRVKMSSVRYKVFAKGLTCPGCGRAGTFLMLRRSGDETAADDRAHFNLWCEDPDGTLVMMTKDHIIPASKGGSNDLSNLTTMCVLCNQKKGAEVPDE